MTSIEPIQHLVINPAHVKTPPIIAQTVVAKFINVIRSSENFTIIGEKSYLKKTPGWGKFWTNTAPVLLTMRACSVYEN